MLGSNDTLDAMDETIVDETEGDQVEAEELVITIEGEEVEADPDIEIQEELGPKGVAALRELRAAKKASDAQLKAAREELARRDVVAVPAVIDAPRPKMEEFGYDDDAHAVAMEKWLEDQREIKAQKERAVAADAENRKDYSERFSRYNASKSAYAIDDAVEGVIRSTLTDAQQSMIIRNSADPAKLVKALAQSPKALAELSKIKDADRFAYRLAGIERDIKMVSKSPPPPESRLSGNVVGSSGTMSGRLAAAEAKADKTGDRTEVNQIKRAMKLAGR